MNLLRPEEFEDFTNRRLRVECLRIELLQQGTEGPPRWVGAGFISQSDDGGMEFVLYDTQYRLDSKDLFNNALVLGEFIPDDQYFVLRASDQFGRDWKSNPLIPHPSGSLQGRGSVVRGKIRDVSSVSELDSADDLWLYFPQKVNFPHNELTTTVVSSAGRTSKSVERNTWIIDDERYRIVVEGIASGMNLRVAPTSGSLPYGLDTRLEEALWFVLAQRIGWAVLHETKNRVNRIVLRESISDGNARFRPPLEFDRDPLADDSSRMFRDYLRYIGEYKAPRFHPVSVEVRNILRGGGTIQEEAVAICIAVESIVRYAFPRHGAPTDDVVKATDVALSLIESAEGLQVIKERVKGCIRKIKDEADVRNTLRRLASTGVISEALVTAWERLRNPLVHKYRSGLTEYEIVKETDKVHGLFVLLVLNIIGYKGPFTDHAIPGWPTPQFPLQGADESTSDDSRRRS